MNIALKTIAAALAALMAAGGTSAIAQCQDKPNLTNVVATMSRVDYLAGGQPSSVADDVLMADFNISVANTGGVDAAQSRLQYSADVKSLGGKTVEKVDGTSDINDVAAGGTENGLVTIMVSSLSDLLQPSGEIRGAIVFHVVVDVDNEIRECDETDNAADVTVELRTEKVVS
jgi:hypothetical protein